MIAFAIAIFVGAFLLLQVQPLIGKFILPWFGGGTAVWTTCMLFFQVLLLGGYAYAHASATRLKPRAQALLHLGLLLAALAFLPVIPGSQWKPAPGQDPTWRILLLLVATVGLPYFVLSATGPLVQHWYRLSTSKGSPYWLYGLSNAGSLLALVSYPFVFEPVFTRRAQAIMWSCGLGLYGVAILICCFRLWKSATAAEVTLEPSFQAESESTGSAMPKLTKCLWLALPASASVLLLAITNKICLDVVVMPFLWVLPLGLYLLSFVLCFNGGGWYWRKFYSFALIPTLLLAYNEMFEPGSPSVVVKIAVFSAALFNCCMVCHGELYRLRPTPDRLTGYYLMISAGGAMGGILVAIAAPLLFSDYWELHWGFALCVAILALAHWNERAWFEIEGKRFPLWKFSAAGAILLSALLLIHFKQASRARVATSRNFYGVLRVQVGNQAGPQTPVRTLSCGTTLHGFQPLDPALSRTPTAYYHERSGIGLLFENFPQKEGRRVGVVGLGVGTVATYGRPGDVFRFYEINPAVVEFANGYFSYLSNSTARVEIVMGDARLSMEREEAQKYDILVLDAFSSDAIPVHLLTKEAFAAYMRHLKRGGVIAAHISGRHVDLVPVLAKTAHAFGLQSLDLHWRPTAKPWWTLHTHWYLLSRDSEVLDLPAMRAGMTENAQMHAEIPVWTDDFSSLLPLLK